jgi:tungstate transport system ATP-binding protein
VTETFLTLRDIKVRYGALAVLQIDSLEVQRGDVLAIIGPNGAGKSTLLRVMGLLQRPDEGTVWFRGERAWGSGLLPLRRRIATVFQEPLLLNETVYRNAALGLRLRGIRNGEIDKRLKPWLERLGIAPLMNRTAHTLSGGEAQRTSLARALVLEPELLLLDEPFAALDPTSRESLLRDFHRIVKETGVTTVFVTHDHDEAYALANRVGVINAGRLLQLGSRDEVFAHPAAESVAAIVGIENRLAGRVEQSDGRTSVILVKGQSFRVPGKFAPGSEIVLCIRPEDVRIGRANCEMPNLNRLIGKVAGVFPGMSQTRILLDCGGFQLAALVERREIPDLNLSEGKEVMTVFSATSVHVIEVERDRPGGGH